MIPVMTSWHHDFMTSWLRTFYGSSMKKHSDQQWYEIPNFCIFFISNQKCHHLKLSPFEKYYNFQMKWEMSPFDCVTIWNYIWIFISVWKCHHLNMSPYWYESPFFIFMIFFRPSIHMVTNVTIWVLGLKIFTPVTKKWLSNGDDQKGFTIENWIVWHKPDKFEVIIRFMVFQVRFFQQ